MIRTKIVATMGPACADVQMLRGLFDAGVDVCRLNFSHGSHSSHATVFAAIRAAAVRTGCHAAIMQDLSGPKIRTGAIVGGGPLRFKEGDEIRLGTGDQAGSDGRIFTPYAALVHSVDSTGLVSPRGGRPIAVVGLKDVVVIDSGDAVLVTTRERAQDVKKIVEQLKELGRTDLT